MGVPTTIRDLHEAVRAYPLRFWGDEVEQGSSEIVETELPAYEVFWQLFVLPFRQPNDVWIRLDLPPHHEAVCIFNYSALRAILRSHAFLSDGARRHGAKGEVGSDLFYDFCIWLTIAYERAKALAGALHFYLMSPEDLQKRSLKGDGWKRHATDLDAFLGTDIVARLIGGQDDVEVYRHYVIHGPKLPGGLDRVPKSGVLEGLVYWSDWARAGRGDEKAWLRDTVERLDLMNSLWVSARALFNEFWQTVVDQVVGRIGPQGFCDQGLVHLPTDITPAPGLVGGITAVAPGPTFPRIPSGTTYPPGIMPPYESSN